MTPEVLYLSAFACSAVLVVGSTVAEKVQERKMKLVEAKSLGSQGLRPVEIGYMLRGGDTNHALLVMGVDLLQRAVKQQLGATIPEPAQYELKMWSMAKDTAKDWALKKVDAHLLPDLKKNPVGFVKKMYDLYLFFTKSLKLVVKDIVADPRQLKRYFTVAGVMRLLADFATAGYQHAFDQELRTYLVQSNLLVSETKKKKAAQSIASIAAISFITIAIVSYVLTLSAAHAAIISATALITSFILTAIFAAREFVPHITEFESLASALSRSSWRVKLLKILARLLIVILSVGSFLICVALFLVSFAFHNMAGGSQAFEFTFLTVILCLPCVKAFLLLLKSWKLSNMEVATEYGETALAEAKDRLVALSPIGSLSLVLKDESYNPVFSELMALYGVEALILLA